MKKAHLVRLMMVLGSGTLLLQAGGCSVTTLNEYLQTVLLGITAAGAVTIMRNI